MTPTTPTRYRRGLPRLERLTAAELTFQPGTCWELEVLGSGSTVVDVVRGEAVGIAVRVGTVVSDVLLVRPFGKRMRMHALSLAGIGNYRPATPTAEELER